MFFIFNVFFISKNPQRHGSISDGFKAVENLPGMAGEIVFGRSGRKKQKNPCFLRKKRGKERGKIVYIIVKLSGTVRCRFPGRFLYGLISGNPGNSGDSPQCRKDSALLENAGKGSEKANTSAGGEARPEDRTGIRVLRAGTGKDSNPKKEEEDDGRTSCKGTDV